jgi:chromosome segregation ATPase
MDPISILSVAAAVVAFVDFGGKMLSSTWYHLRRDDDMTIPLEDLAREAGQLGRLSRQILSTRGRPGSPEGQNLEFNAVLAELAKEAAQVSEDVESLISTLQTANEKRKNQSLRLHLIKAAKDGGSEYSANEKKMQAAEDRLRGIKTDMMSAVLACLWYVPACKAA